MKCPSCGRENGDDVNFCFYCGYSFRERPVVMQEEKITMPGYEQAPSVPPYRPDPKEASESIVSSEKGNAMPTWQWLLYFLTLAFPFTWIIFLIVTGVWAFGDKASQERKNFAKALLGFLLFLIVFSILTVIILIATQGLDGAISYLTDGKATSAEAFMEMYGR